MTRLLGILAGPIGWAVTAIWTAIDIAGPAFRVTIPATIYIAALRQAELNKQSFDIKCPHCKAQLVVNDAKFCPSCGGAL
jgi:Zn finger protein HypA/HybF involved in hydrogenase expression